MKFFVLLGLIAVVIAGARQDEVKKCLEDNDISLKACTVEGGALAFGKVKKIGSNLEMNDQLCIMLSEVTECIKRTIRESCENEVAERAVDGIKEELTEMVDICESSRNKYHQYYDAPRRGCYDPDEEYDPTY